ncbi:MAG: class I SAM-dependent methyltransferase [Gemmatimonadales bacterium]|nr:class I SAM-dependent methyltransferase [Gemmatimonadales bacterium]
MRPSKCFLYETMSRALSEITSGVGVDVASGNLKNRWMFKTELYVGIDINETRLRSGLKTHPTPDTVAAVADLRVMDAFPTGAATAVVSTNTLHHIDRTNRVSVVESLVRMTAPGGVLFCTTPLDTAFPGVLAALERSFDDVKCVYYRNVFSRAYEELLAPPGRAERGAIAATKPFRLLAWVVSRLEHLTKNRPAGCTFAFILCRRKSSPASESFSLSHLPRLDERLYDARRPPPSLVASVRPPG